MNDDQLTGDWATANSPCWPRFHLLHLYALSRPRRHLTHTIKQFVQMNTTQNISICCITSIRSSSPTTVRQLQRFKVSSLARELQRVFMTNLTCPSLNHKAKSCQSCTLQISDAKYQGASRVLSTYSFAAKSYQLCWSIASRHCQQTPFLFARRYGSCQDAFYEETCDREVSEHATGHNDCLFGCLQMQWTIDWLCDVSVGLSNLSSYHTQYYYVCVMSLSDCKDNIMWK